MRRANDKTQKKPLRTRAHIIADLSVHHVEGFVLRQGYIVEAFRRDYGYDLTMLTFDYRQGTDGGEFEPEFVPLQLKATETLTTLQDGKTIAFPGIKRHHINLWIASLMPVFLIVYDAVGGVAYWLDVHEYVRSEAFAIETSPETVTVRIPMANVVDAAAIETFRQRKQERYATLKQRGGAVL